MSTLLTPVVFGSGRACLAPRRTGRPRHEAQSASARYSRDVRGETLCCCFVWGAVRRYTRSHPGRQRPGVSPTLPNDEEVPTCLTQDACSWSTTTLPCARCSPSTSLRTATRSARPTAGDRKGV